MILLCLMPDNFTLSNAREFYSVLRQIIYCLMPDDFTRKWSAFGWEKVNWVPQIKIRD